MFVVESIHIQINGSMYTLVYRKRLTIHSRNKVRLSTPIPRANTCPCGTKRFVVFVLIYPRALLALQISYTFVIFVRKRFTV